MTRLFLLDMLLGNPDRLPCEALGWRGNPHNILYATAGGRAGRMVAIDSAVQRRPPGAHLLCITQRVCKRYMCTTCMTCNGWGVE